VAETAVTVLDLNFQGRERAIAVYLLRHADGAVLVECGPGSCLPALEAELARHGVAPTDVTHVLLTHIHLDHAGAAGWWSRQGAEIIVHPVGAPHLLQPEKLLASAARIYGHAMGPLWGEVLPVEPARLRVAADGEELAIGALRFLPINTPGHAEHHFAYMHEGLCFSGDVGGVRIPGYPYLRVPMPPPELHLGKWRESLARLREQHPDRIAPTHFGIYDDVDWQLREVEKGVDAAERWLDEMMATEPTTEALREGFEQWMADEAAEQGLSEDVMQCYALANPPGMSADGLERYWRKHRASSTTGPGRAPMVDGSTQDEGV